MIQWKKFKRKNKVKVKITYEPSGASVLELNPFSLA